MKQIVNWKKKAALQGQYRGPMSINYALQTLHNGG